MKNYTEGITEEIIISNNIDKLQVIGENGLKPRMIVKYKDGDEDITKFVNNSIA
jgi:hypothetical protein